MTNDLGSRVEGLEHQVELLTETVKVLRMKDIKREYQTFNWSFKGGAGND